LELSAFPVLHRVSPDVKYLKGGRRGRLRIWIFLNWRIASAMAR
jgi:hypothetical protein